MLQTGNGERFVESHIRTAGNVWSGTNLGSTRGSNPGGANGAAVAALKCAVTYFGPYKDYEDIMYKLP